MRYPAIDASYIFDVVLKPPLLNKPMINANNANAITAIIKRNVV
jgi:hypothetical protein